MKITPHFSLHEFHCRSGHKYPEDWIETRLKPLCEALEVLRKEVKAAIIISSGYRDEHYNKKIGGAKHSQHLQGRAVDFYCTDLKPAFLHFILLKLIKEGKIPDGGVGLYPTFVHYDQRGYRSRWKGGRTHN